MNSPRKPAIRVWGSAVMSWKTRRAQVPVAPLLRRLALPEAAPAACPGCAAEASSMARSAEAQVARRHRDQPWLIAWRPRSALPPGRHPR
jgi:hypothetical protein